MESFKGILTIDKDTVEKLAQLRQYGEFMKRLMIVGYNSMILAHNLKRERARIKEVEIETQGDKVIGASSVTKSELPQSIVKVAMRPNSHRGHRQKAAGKGNKKKS